MSDGMTDMMRDPQYHNKPQAVRCSGPAPLRPLGFCTVHGETFHCDCYECVKTTKIRAGVPVAPVTVTPPTVQPGYEPLAKVLQAALDQSQCGKGKERHATAGKPFVSQPICEIGRMVGVGYNVGQAMKKGQEAMRLPRDRAQAELLGAIVYLASAYLLVGESKECDHGKV